MRLLHFDKQVFFEIASRGYREACATNDHHSAATVTQATQNRPLQPRKIAPRDDLANPGELRRSRTNANGARLLERRSKPAEPADAWSMSSSAAVAVGRAALVFDAPDQVVGGRAQYRAAIQGAIQVLGGDAVIGAGFLVAVVQRAVLVEHVN